MGREATHYRLWLVGLVDLQAQNWACFSVRLIISVMVIKDNHRKLLILKAR